MTYSHSARALVSLLFLAAIGCPSDDDDAADKSGETGEETGDTGVDKDDEDDKDVTDDDDPVTSGDTGTPDPVAFTLQLLHFADVDSNEATALSNMESFSALVDGFSKDATYGDASILVSSGDNLIPGPRWFAAENTAVRAISGSNEPGNADHYIMNQMGVVASVVGNHDLDQGPGEFGDAIKGETYDPDRDVAGDEVTFPGTEFPYLAANIDFTAELKDSDGDVQIVRGTDGADVGTLGGQVAASATVTVDGETIGLVGVATPDLPNITTTGDLVLSGTLDPISGLAAAVQPAIDALVGDGIDKIIVLAHLQDIANEKALAGELEDVDIIVAGGSNRRMGDGNDALYTGDDAFDETYPFETTNKDGDPLLIVNVDGDYKYLGRLVVGFDSDGVVVVDSVDDTVSGAYASIDANVTASGGTAITEVVGMHAALQTVIEAQYDNVIGHTDEYLEGRRNKVRTEETNLGNLTADANKWYAQQCDDVTNVVALKNGGGIRAEIGEVVVIGDVTTLTPPANDGLPTAMEGDVSEGHLRGTLRFDNGLVVLDVTGVELKMLLEHGVAATTGDNTPGQFPQVGGMQFGFDPSGVAQVLDFDGDDIKGIKTAGTRITDLYIDTTGEGLVDTALYIDGVEQAAASETYQLVTLNFLANGGDNYPFALLDNANRRQTYSGLNFGDPDADENDEPDFPVLTNCDPAQNSDFSYTGGEQDALTEYMSEFYPDSSMPFDVAETAPADDRRIQDLSVIADFVAPQVSPLVLTAIVEGDRTGGTPKAVEVYVLEDVDDLSICGLGAANNGGGTDGEEFTFSGSAKSGDYLWVATEETEFSAFFGYKPDFLSAGGSGAANVSGDDAVELFCNGLVTDVFGDINVDGTGQAWEYTNGWAYRNDGTGPDGDTFVIDNWTILEGAIDEIEVNTKAESPVPDQSYSPTVED